MKVYGPLRNDHPLVLDRDRCPLCKKGFYGGQRTMLVPAREPTMGPESVPAIPVHASCALSGMRTPKGTIERIKEGDASPFPVLTDQGQFKLEEVGLA